MTSPQCKRRPGWWAMFALLGWLCVGLFSGPARAQGVGQWVSPGPLAQDHADIEGLANCTKCHSPLMGVSPERCTSCHDDVGEQIATKKGFHANKATACEGCHPDHRGRDFPLARVQLSPIMHLKETGFPLEGAHIRAECTDCHTPGDWAAVEPACSSCHDSPHGDREHVDLSACQKCHTAQSWDVSAIAEAVFDHQNPKQTDYVLRGAHVGVDCESCHAKGRFVPTEFTRCTTCHDDPHRSPQISNNCESCHDVQAWYVAKFAHALTGWPLEGLHAGVSCAGCHQLSATKAVPHDTCESCHRDPHRKQFAPQTCDSCHAQTVAKFKIPDFDHEETAYPLRGEHASVACGDCHGAGTRAKYRPLAHDDCDACHKDAHNGSFEPTPCGACHQLSADPAAAGASSWSVAQFDHDRTDYPLLGKHEDVACEQCHPAEKWAGIAHQSCLDCHEEQPHGTLFTADRCDGCHAETGFADVTFAHAEETSFDLAPQHSTQPCTSCHDVLDRFSGLQSNCRFCHLWDPPPGHYEGECEDCHRAADWRPADLGGRSHDITGYPLVGTHSLLACEDCHGAEDTPLSAGGTDCADCHADDDAHRHLLGDVCEDCHTPVTWFRTSFQHATTGFPLRGAHRLAACEDCHAVRYVGTPDECRFCHEAEAPLDEPAHQSAFFTHCDECHRPYTWAALPSTASRGTKR